MSGCEVEGVQAVSGGLVCELAKWDGWWGGGNQSQPIAFGTELLSGEVEIGQIIRRAYICVLRRIYRNVI